MFAVTAVTQVIKKKKDPESHKSLQIDSTFISFFFTDVRLFCLFVFNGALLN